MRLTIATEPPPAAGLGFLLHKHPDRFQSFGVSFGLAQDQDADCEARPQHATRLGTAMPRSRVCSWSSRARERAG